MAKSRMVNSSRWQKHLTVMITNELKAVAEDTGVNVRLVVADKLEQTYKDNLKASYGPRSAKGAEIQSTHKRKTSTYNPTSPTLENAITTVIEGNYVKIKIKDEKYPNGASTEQVHDWLSEGTKGGGKKTGFYKDENGEWHYNYPTPPHPFEEHTRNEMRGFLDSLVGDIRNHKYTTYRYTGKKKKRTHYRGEDLTQQR